MELVIIGQGGHSKVIRELVQSASTYRIAAFLDDKYKEWTMHQGIVLGPVSLAKSFWRTNRELKFVVAIGNNEIRERIAAVLGLPDECYVTLIHETATVSPSARIGRGTVVMARAVVNADTCIGRHAIINTGAIIEHDVRLGDYVHVAPHATLTGAVDVQEGAVIGAAATVIPGIAIGQWAIVGAGATVIAPIPAHATAVGIPARIIKYHSGKVVM